MNPIPDLFEWRLMRRNFLWLSGLFVLVYLAALVLQFFPGQWAYVHPERVAAARILGIVTALAGAWFVAGLSEGSSWLSPAAASLILGQFVVGTTGQVTGGTDAVVATLNLLVSGTLYLFLVGFFSRRQKTTLALGAVLLVVALAIYGPGDRGWFPQTVSREVLAASALQITVFGLALVTALVFLIMKTSAALTTRAHEAAEALRVAAYQDLDSGLPNARAYEARMADAGRQPLGRLALVGLRLSGLDELNETRGIQATSTVVGRLARNLNQTWAAVTDRQAGLAPPPDLRGVFRFDGTTFLLWFAVPPGGLPDVAAGRDLFEALVAQENSALAPGPGLGFRGGFSLFPDDGSQLEQVTRNVLHLLHRPSPGTQGQVVPFNSEAYQAYRRQQRIRELVVGLPSSGQLQVVFQPQGRPGGQLVGFEALSRWSSPDLGPVGPQEFIPAAEDTGAIAGLTFVVLEESFRLIRSLEAQGCARFRVAVNLSPGLLGDAVLDELTRRVAEAGVGPHLELEITEGLLMVLDAQVRDRLSRLRSLGVSFAIDDFGTGYSNLGYLQNFEAEVLKIDKRFIDGTPGDEKSSRLVETMVKMAQGFGMEVVAEGVEHSDQEAFLGGIGCQTIQGYYLSRPVTYEAAAALAGRFTPAG